jgi:uncharacterized protein with HEPN domain
MSVSETERIGVYLANMVEAIEDINLYLKDVDKTAFTNNKEKQHAVRCCAEIVGAAAGRIIKEHGDFANTHSYIPWQTMYDTRNRTAHGYGGINLDILWKVIHEDLPTLLAPLKQLL